MKKKIVTMIEIEVEVPIGKIDVVIEKLVADSDYVYTFSEIATHFGYSERQLARLFKEETGMTFTQFYEQIKVDQAKALLHTIAEPVDQICEVLGFEEPRTLMRKFKKISGVAMERYRKESRDN